ncbi:hypothetical protein SASPL_112011 [Salvia splendens]|uniref:phosphatidylserine decarboxylase n=1 Tax=Salvia splendens TaxID=180675 RepID=A0A8X8YAH4_SALSN|nr:hypothetical protein SASPL_112011 [Salvia splendens]
MTKWRASRSIPLLNYNRICLHRRFHFTTFLCSARPAQPQASFRGGASNSSGSSQGNSFLVPGATVATILMLGALHVRRMYDDKQIEEAKAKGIESEFHPDVKILEIATLALYFTVLGLLDWNFPFGYGHMYIKHGLELFTLIKETTELSLCKLDLEEAQLPLEEYASLREFFVRKLKESSRPIDSDPCCLVSPVDGTVLRFGELRGPGAMIEQVKGCSYSASSLLGANSHLPMIAAEDANEDSSKEEKTVRDVNQKSWWSHLFPMNERATRTIRNLYVENERVVLEGQWKQGYMAMAAIGATNIGSIELFIEPTLKTNNPQEKLIHSLPPDERLYEPEGTGVPLRKGDEVAAFNMGSTVVLVFQAPISQSGIIKESSSDFRFCIKRGDRIRMGEPLGRWNQS